MSRNDWLFLAVLGVPTVVGTTALARTGISILFESLDADSDGVVTFLEFEQSAMERWAESDVNHDGKVTAEEVVSIDGGSVFHGTEFVEVPGDIDGDGAISEAEARAAALELALRLDTDGDERLSEEELDAGRHVEGQVGEGAPPVR